MTPVEEQAIQNIILRTRRGARLLTHTYFISYRQFAHARLPAGPEADPRSGIIIFIIRVLLACNFSSEITLRSSRPN